MSIPNVNKSFNGMYLCSVEERMEDGSIEMEEQQLTLDIKGILLILFKNIHFHCYVIITDEIKPIILSTNMNNSDFTLVLGMPKIHFYCTAKGIPYPKIQWFKVSILINN